MLNKPNNIEEAVDILKHTIDEEQKSLILNMPEEKQGAFILDIKDIIDKEWDDRILKSLISDTIQLTKNEIILKIAKALWDVIKGNDTIGQKANNVSMNNRKDSVDLKLLSGLYKWIIIGYSDNMLLPNITPQGGTHLIGYLINNHYSGLKAMITNWAIIVDNRIVLTRDVIIQDGTLLSLGTETIKRTYFDIIDPTTISMLNLPMSPTGADLYSNEKLDMLRGIKYLDELRHPDYPDDVLIKVDLSNIKSERIPEISCENMWGRLEDKIDSETFLCTLLNTSYWVPQLKKGTTLTIKYTTNNDYPELICDLSTFYN